jgi:hypothetical protein
MDSSSLDALEDMALTVCDTDNPGAQAIQKWIALGYGRVEAESILANISDVETKGLNRGFTPAELRQTIYVILAHPLDTAAKVKEAAVLDRVPEIKTGNSEDTGEKVRMCSVGVRGKFAIKEWIAAQGLWLKPFFITARKAIKDFDSSTCSPTLGHPPTTLPQFRPSHLNQEFRPMQNEYPVWYFFYGTLGDDQILRKALGHSDVEELDLKEAWIQGGKLKRWGTYKALVDGIEIDVVRGKAYLVKSEEEEDKLLFYETEAYDVARCRILFSNGEQSTAGCAFRIGDGLDVR